MLLRTPGDDDACLRTLDSLATQTVLVEVCGEFSALDAADRPYVVFVLAGVVLDVTACERAVWLLHTHPHLTCVTGAQRGTAGRIAAIASATQFLVVRTVLAKRLLGSGDVADASTAIALLLGARMESQRVAGWLSDPAILAACDAALLARIESDARKALAQLGVPPEALVAAVDQDPPRLPIQELARPAVPPITVRDRECSGLRLLVLLQGFPMGG